LRYREQNNAQGLSRQDLLGQRLASLQGQAIQTQAGRQQKETQFNQGRNEDPTDDKIDAFPIVGANRAVIEAKSALRDAQSKLQQLTRDGFGEDYPPFRTAKAEAQSARDKLVGARRTVIESLRQEYQAALTTERSVQAQLDAVKGEANG